MNEELVRAFAMFVGFLLIFFPVPASVSTVVVVDAVKVIYLND